MVQYICISCNTEVRLRQHAVSCDVCERWQHRLCNTGIMLEMYNRARHGHQPQDYYCGLIFDELENGPVSQSDLIINLRKQKISSSDVQTCLATMEENGSIERSKRGNLSEPIWQLITELQSLDYKDVEDAEPFEKSLNDLSERLDNSSITSNATNEEITVPKSSISLPPPAVKLISRGDKASIRSEQTSLKTLPPQSGEHSLEQSLSSSVFEENETRRSLESRDSQSLTESPAGRGSFSSSTSSGQSCLYTQTTRQENDQSVRLQQSYISQTQTGPNTQTISTGLLQMETGAPVNSYQQSEVDPKLRQTVEDLRKIIEVFDNNSRDFKPKDVARIAKIGESRKSVNKFLYYLNKKKILTVKTGENNTDPRWSKCPGANYTDKDLKEWAAELVYSVKGPAETPSVHHHHHNHKHNNYLQVGDNNQMDLHRSQSQREQMRENEVEEPSEDLVDQMQNHPS